MKANKAKELTNGKVMDMRNKHQAKLDKYTKRLTETKVKRMAKKGYASISITVPKKYLRSQVRDRLQNMGYQTELMKDMKIMIKWGGNRNEKI